MGGSGDAIVSVGRDPAKGRRELGREGSHREGRRRLRAIRRFRVRADGAPRDASEEARHRPGLPPRPRGFERERQRGRVRGVRQPPVRHDFGRPRGADDDEDGSLGSGGDDGGGDPAARRRRDAQRVPARAVRVGEEPVGSAEGVLGAHPPRVGLARELARGLAKVGDLVLRRLQQRRVGDRLHVHVPLVRQVIENVVGPHRRGPALLVPEDEVYPQVQVPGDVLALERGAIFGDKVKGVCGPRRQSAVVNGPPGGLLHPEIHVVDVDEHLREVIKLGDELLHVGHVGRDAFPAGWNVIEESVGVVKLAPLQLVRE